MKSFRQLYESPDHIEIDSKEYNYTSPGAICFAFVDDVLLHDKQITHRRLFAKNIKKTKYREQIEEWLKKYNRDWLNNFDSLGTVEQSRIVFRVLEDYEINEIMKCMGRAFVEIKIITFWDYENVTPERMKVIRKELDIDDDWKVEIEDNTYVPINDFFDYRTKNVEPVVHI